MVDPEPRVASGIRLAPRSGRQWAWQLLEQARTADGFLEDLVEESTGGLSLPLSDRRLAWELTHGVTRRQRTLDAVIEAAASRRPDQVEPGLWSILRLGVYQLLFCDGIPDHAAVHETVELARGVTFRWTGFANGILRNVQRQLTGDFVDEPGPDRIPVQRGKYRRLATPMFVDPSEHLAEYFGAAFSQPDVLASRWASRLRADELFRWGFWFNATPSRFLRVNRQVISDDDFAAALIAAEVPCSPGPIAGTWRLDVGTRVRDLPGFDQGWFVVQDPTAVQAAQLLAPRPGERVWDVCAAPGTKTMLLAELMQNRGQLVASDVHRQRLERVAENARRLQFTIVEPWLIGHHGEGAPDRPCDAILLDVPCSNTGVLSKRIEARWRFSLADLAELSELQRTLLELAAARLKVGGRLVYSTCSVEPEENEQQIQRFLSSRTSSWVVRKEQSFQPGQPADGGYSVLLERTA